MCPMLLVYLYPTVGRNAYSPISFFSAVYMYNVDRDSFFFPFLLPCTWVWWWENFHCTKFGGHRTFLCNLTLTALWMTPV